MRRDHRSRRSESSCSMYSQHSSSLMMLDPVDHNYQKMSKIDEKYPQIEQKCILPIYDQLKKYQTDNTKVDSQKLSQWRTHIKVFIKKLRTLTKSQQQTISSLKSSLLLHEKTHQKQLQTLISKHCQQLHQLKLSHSQQMSELSHRQLSYKQALHKFSCSMQQTQRVCSAMQEELVGKLGSIVKIVNTTRASQGKYSKIFDSIRAIIRDNGGHSSSSPVNNDDSLRSINLSDFGDQGPRVFTQGQGAEGQEIYVNQVKNMVDMSSIQQIQMEEQSQPVHNTNDHENIQCCVVRLIADGFFSEKNKGVIKRIRSLTKDLEQPQSITHEPIFQLILQSIKVNLDLDQDEDRSLMEINQNTEIEQPKSNRKLVIRAIDTDISVN